MDEQERKLYQLFSEKERLTTEEPAAAAAFTPPVEKLQEGERRARALFAEGPDLELSPDKRAELGAGRFPELQGVVSLFGAGLAKHADIVAEIGAGADLLDRVVRVDMGLGRLAWAAELLLRGGENGELITAAAMQAACQGLISQASSAASGTAHTPAQRRALSAAFTEPERIEKQRRDREAQTRATADKAAAPFQAAISQAEESAAMTRVIEAYLDHVRRGA